MISEKVQRAKYVFGDWLTGNIALFVFDWLRYTLLGDKAGYLTFERYIFSTTLLLEQALIPVGLLIVYYYSGYYNSPFHKSRVQELISTTMSAVVATVLIYFMLLTNDQVSLRTTNYEMLGLLFGSLMIFTYAGRIIITQSAINKLRKHQWKFRTIIVGASEEAAKTAANLRSSKSTLGYDVIAFVRLPEEERRQQLMGLPVIEFDELFGGEYNGQFSQLIVVPSDRNDTKLLRLVDKLFKLDIPVKIVPDTFTFVTSGIRLHDIFGEPLIDLTSPQISASGKNVKRTFDILLSAIAMIVTAIPMAIIAMCVKLSSPGKVIYKQERIGYRQRPFTIYKFRTMRSDSEPDGKPRLSSPNDSRITKVGKVLRKYRLDEFPQFWNVLKGDMSLVGPRPERPYFIKQIVKEVPFYTLVHQVRPGITSWGMVKFGYAGSLEEMVRRTRYELIYLQNMSVTVDMKILVYTIKTVLTGKGM